MTTTPFDPLRRPARPLWASMPLTPLATPPAPPPVPRPEAPHTHLTVHALSARERTTLRGLSPTLATDLEAAERLRSSPLLWLRRGVTAASAAGEVDELRHRARTALGAALTAP
jgi:hypothetical protein